MNLLFLRHGQAEDTASNGSDDDRALTDEGKKQLAEMRPLIWKLFPSPDRVFSSPALRARQTAALAIEGLDCKIELVEELRSEAEPADFSDFLQKVSEENILAVSHQPFLGRTIGLLTTGRDQNVASMPRAGICLIEYDMRDGRGRLRSVMRPEQLQALLRR